MFRSIALSLALGLLFPVAALSATATDHARTCAYFGKRADAHRVGDRGLWLRLLSDSCLEALRRNDAAGDGATPADAAYLASLGTLRAVVIGMNMARFTADPGAARTRRTVSASGEYLIAHQIGVMAAYSAWAEASASDSAHLAPR